MMTPKDILDFILTYNFDFMGFENDIEWKLNESGDVDEKGRTLYQNIGEYKTIEEYEFKFDFGESRKHTLIHFETLGFHLEEQIHLKHDEVESKEYFLVEPIQKIVFGNHQKLN
jgi:hypothetical protein